MDKLLLAIYMNIDGLTKQQAEQQANPQAQPSGMKVSKQ